MIEPIRTPRLPDAIAGYFEQLILEGVLRPGDRLASERELAERLDISRPSIRETFEILGRKGLLRSSKSGSFVADFLAPLTTPLSTLLQSSGRVTKDYFEYREAVEVRATALATLRSTSLDHEAIRDCVSRMDAAHGLDDPSAEAAADADLHMLIYEASHNVVILQVMRAFSQMLRQGIFYNRKLLYGRTDVRDTLISQHKSIADAIVSGDASRAEKAASDHIHFTAKAVESSRQDAERLDIALRRLVRHDLVSANGTT